MDKDPAPPSYNQAGAYPPQYAGAAYPPQGYPPQGGAYPPQGGAYPPQGYPPQGGAYPPQGYPPQGGAYPPPGVDFPPPKHQPQNSSYSVDIDHDDGLIRRGNVSRGFDNADVRRGFIRKVYIILCIQFSITVAAVLGMKFTIGKTLEEGGPEADALASKVFIFMWVCLAVFFVTEIALVCCEGLRRKHPINLILLFVFTVAMSGFVGCVTLYYNIDAVLIALGSTVIITLGLTLFAIQTKFDITGMGMYIFAIFLVFFCFGFFMIFFHSRALQVVYGCVGVLIFSLFLVYDTQLLVGGRKYELTEEEYVFAALSIYIDVIQIFLFLLRILGNNN